MNIDLDDILKSDNKPKTAYNSGKPSPNKYSSGKDKGFQKATNNADDDIEFFNDGNDFFQDERQKSSSLHKFDRKVEQRSATTVDFNRMNNNSNKKKDNEFDELLGLLDNKSSYKPSSNLSNRNVQGQYNQSQPNYFQELTDDIDDDNQKKSQFGMTGMTLQTTVSKHEDFLPRQFNSQQDNNIIRKSAQDLGYFEKQEEGYDVETAFSRRNVRRAETFKPNTDDDPNKLTSNYFGKPPISGSMFTQNNSAVGKQGDPFLSVQLSNKRDTGLSNTRLKQNDDNFLHVSEEDEDDNKGPKSDYKSDYKSDHKSDHKGSFGITKAQSSYPFAGGIFDTGTFQPQHNRVQSHQEFGQNDGTKSLQGLSKKGAQQDQDDVLEDCGYNPSSTSRLAASKRPRTGGQREHNSQPTSMNNTLSNINLPQKQQQYPRLMKSPEDSQHANLNTNFFNESGGFQQKQTKSQGTKNESSLMSDKDLLGASDNQGQQQFDDNLNFDQRYSRRSSFMRGDASKNTGVSPSNPTQGGLFAPNQQQQGGLGGIHDLKYSETNFQQNNANNFDKIPADPKQQYRYNQEDVQIQVMKQLEEERKKIRAQINQENDETLKKMKNNYEDQIKSIKDNYEQLIKFERDRNLQQQDEIKDIIIKDRERQRQLFDIEIENLKVQHDKEKTQINMSYELQNESLKKQLQQQAQIIGLAEQLKQNSERLNFISHQIENTSEKNQIDMQRLNQDAQEKNKYIKEQEARLKLEAEFIDSEKKRLEKLKSELASSEENQRTHLEKEKQIIRTEYTRLNELQDQIKEQEVEKKKDLVHEKNKLETERVQLSEEQQTKIKLKEDYENLYKDFELKVAIFEQSKKEFEQGMMKIENKQAQQLKEIEAKKIDMLKQEQLIVQKQKLLELKEYELRQQEQEYGLVFKQIKSEKIHFDREKKGLQVLADKVDTENNVIREFRTNFDMERMRLQQKEQDLEEREKNLRRQENKMFSDKKEVSQLQDTLRNLKSNFVKELVTSPSNSLTLTPSYQNFVSPSKFNPPTQQSFKSPTNYQSFRQTLNPDMTANSTKYDTKRNIAKEVERDMAQRDYEKNSGYNKQIMQNKFDLKGFMTSMKEVDQMQRDNIAYIMSEKDNLNSNRPKERFPTFSYNESGHEQHSYSERSINAHSYVEN